MTAVMHVVYQMLALWNLKQKPVEKKINDFALQKPWQISTLFASPANW